MTSDPLSRYLAQRNFRLDRRSKLRPMSTGETLDASLGIYQTIGWDLLRISVGPAFACVAALVFIFQYAVPSLVATSSPDNLNVQLFEAVVALGITVFVGAPALFLSVSYAAALISQVVGDTLLGSQPDIAVARRAARKNLSRAVVIAFVEAGTSLGVLSLGVCLVMLSAWITTNFPGNDSPIFVMICAFSALILGALAFPVALARYALAIPVTVHEGLPVRQALRRGAQLLKALVVQGRIVQPSGYDTVIALTVLMAILLGLVYGGIAAALSLVGARDWIHSLSPNIPYWAVLTGAIDYLPIFVTVWVLVPVWCTTSTILYYERRVRLEGYDIDTLAKDIWRGDRQSRFEL